MLEFYRKVCNLHERMIDIVGDSEHGKFYPLYVENLDKIKCSIKQADIVKLRMKREEKEERRVKEERVEQIRVQEREDRLKERKERQKREDEEKDIGKISLEVEFDNFTEKLSRKILNFDLNLYRDVNEINCDNNKFELWLDELDALDGKLKCIFREDYNDKFAKNKWNMNGPTLGYLT